MFAHVDEVVVEAGEGGPRAQRYPAPVSHAAVGGPANSSPVVLIHNLSFAVV